MRIWLGAAFLDDQRILSWHDNDHTLSLEHVEAKTLLQVVRIAEASDQLSNTSVLV